tara:strand:+ start:1105 stop:1296 length:192 start_codon:yes stop_codon:yes gene_type:complete
MSRSFLQRERQQLFRNITRQYKQEGYSLRESKRFAKLEVDDIMSDKETFVSNYVRDTWEDADE